MCPSPNHPADQKSPRPRSNLGTPQRSKRRGALPKGAKATTWRERQLQPLLGQAGAAPCNNRTTPKTSAETEAATTTSRKRSSYSLSLTHRARGDNEQNMRFCRRRRSCRQRCPRLHCRGPGANGAERNAARLHRVACRWHRYILVQVRGLCEGKCPTHLSLVGPPVFGLRARFADAVRPSVQLPRRWPSTHGSHLADAHVTCRPLVRCSCARRKEAMLCSIRA